MRSGVTDRQVFFLLFLTLTAYVVISIPKTVAQAAGTGGWLPLMANALLFAVFAALIVRLNSRFPGMTLFEYSGRIAGKFLAHVISVYFILYFLMIATYLCLSLTDVLKVEFYPKTPGWAMLIASVSVFGYIVYRGTASVARFFEIIGAAFVVTAVFTHLVMMQQGNIREIEPFFRTSKIPDYLRGVWETAIAYLGIEILTVFPLGGKSARRTTWVAFLSVIFVGLFYVLVVETSIMKLGIKSVQNYSYALIEAIKQIDFPVLERFDILFLTVGFAGLIAGTCAVYLAAVEYAVRVFKKANRLLVVVCVGLVITACGIWAQSAKGAMDLLGSVVPFAGLASAFLIPAVLLLTAKARGLDGKTR